ncbi:MAG: corrinoid protein [Clostridiales Family XIII bacterium]|jgi:5-methyltetrahydrofolate--homocysteine methyltransferase|nr:corrinoid protein [Clostridiales Family XIII bacterium]
MKEAGMYFQELIEAVSKGDADAVVSLVKRGLDEGVEPQSILDDGLLKAMGEIGEKFKNNEVFVPEVLIAARALTAGTEILKERMGAGGTNAIGKVVIATVAGDLHDIGKNLVKMMMEGVGLEVVDLGVDVTADKIIEAVKEHDADIVALSALLTTTMAYQRTVVEALKDAGLRDKVKVMIGGAPTTQAFCDDIGADGYTADAPSAAEMARDLVS